MAESGGISGVTAYLQPRQVADWPLQSHGLRGSETYEMPKGLSIRLTESSEKGKSVWSTCMLPRGATFGPKDFSDVVTGKATMNEWMRFVEETGCNKLHNVLPYLLLGKIYYRTIKDVNKDTKLLIWYGGKCKCSLHKDDEFDDDDESDDDENDDSSGDEEVSKQREGGIPFPLPPKHCHVQPLVIVKMNACSELNPSVENLVHSNRVGEIVSVGDVKSDEWGNIPDIGTGYADDVEEDDDNIMPLEAEDPEEQFNEIDEEMCTKFPEAEKVSPKSSESEVTNVLDIKCEQENDQYIPSDKDEVEYSDGDDVDNVSLNSKKTNRRKSSPKKKPSKKTRKVKEKRQTKSKDVIIHTCVECGREFKKSQELRQHMQVHSKEKPHKCSVCGKHFGRIGTLKQHAKSHGDKPGKSYPCETCGKEFTKGSSLKAHLRIHTGVRPFICEVCTKAFTNLSDLKRHSRLHTEAKMEPCHICGKEFSELKKHLKTHLKEKKCLTCEKLFDNAGCLRMHIKAHIHEVSHLCLKCGLGFETSDELHEHQPIHATEYPHMCETCGQGFSTSTELKFHIMTHTGELPLKCSICEKGFARSGHYQRHMKMHAGERKYLCGKCGKGLTSSVDLTRHLSIHTGEKPHQCPSCPKAFAVHVDLKRHERSHLDKKPYPCNICENRYSRSEHLRKHMRIHTDPPTVFNCNLCQRSFHKAKHLEAHNRTYHSKEEEQIAPIEEQNIQLYSFFV